MWKGAVPREERRKDDTRYKRHETRWRLQPGRAMSVHTIAISAAASTRIESPRALGSADTFSLLLRAAERPQVKFHLSYRRKYAVYARRTETRLYLLIKIANHKLPSHNPPRILHESAQIALISAVDSVCIKKSEWKWVRFFYCRIDFLSDNEVLGQEYP